MMLQISRNSKGNGCYKIMHHWDELNPTALGPSIRIQTKRNVSSFVGEDLCPTSTLILGPINKFFTMGLRLIMIGIYHCCCLLLFFQTNISFWELFKGKRSRKREGSMRPPNVGVHLYVLILHPLLHHHQSSLPWHHATSSNVPCLITSPRDHWDFGVCLFN